MCGTNYRELKRDVETNSDKSNIVHQEAYKIPGSVRLSEK